MTRRRAKKHMQITWHARAHSVQHPGTQGGMQVAHTGLHLQSPQQHAHSAGAHLVILLTLTCELAGNWPCEPLLT